jgi:hypothetical protein
MRKTKYSELMKIGAVFILIISIMLTGCLDGNGNDDEVVDGIKSVSPKDGASDVPLTTTIEIKFDREVDHQSAEFYFSIGPDINGNFSWDGNTMTFTPSEDLLSGVLYTCVVGKNTKNADGDTFLSEDYRWQFTT